MTRRLRALSRFVLQMFEIDEKESISAKDIFEAKICLRGPPLPFDIDMANSSVMLLWTSSTRIRSLAIMREFSASRPPSNKPLWYQRFHQILDQVFKLEILSYQRFHRGLDLEIHLRYVLALNLI